MKEFYLQLVFGCLLTVASTRLIYKTPDGRYPEYIVKDPRITCTESGFFPHPADCSWFYRCVDQSQLGYFHVFFFECEPGTIFIDQIDQCVFGSKTLPPCTSAGSHIKPFPQPAPPPIPVTISTFAPPQSTSTESTITKLTTSAESSTESSSLATVGSVFPSSSPDTTVEPEIKETTLPPQTTSVPISPETPEPIILLPSPQPPSPETTINPTTAVPVTSPLPPAPPPTSEIPETTSPAEGSQSTISCNNCVSKPICEIGKKPAIKKLCESCRFGLGDFSTAKEICPYHPEPHITSEGRCLAGNQICPILRQEEEAKLKEAFTIQCSDVKTRPDDPEIRRLYCRNYHYCSPFGSFLGTQTLCSNFFQCYKTRNNSWSAELRNCMGRNLYSFDLDQCIQEPRMAELCLRL